MAKTITYHGKYSGIVVSRTNMANVRQRLDMKAAELTERLVLRMEMIGEAAVKLAREVGSYNDITGNLRSSIGYVVLVDGVPAKRGRSEQYRGAQGDGSQGAAAAQQLLGQLQTKFPRGIVLIVCAGMKYAAYVESVRHKDVLASAELRAEELANRLLRKFVQ